MMQQPFAITAAQAIASPMTYAAPPAVPAAVASPMYSSAVAPMSLAPLPTIYAAPAAAPMTIAAPATYAAPMQAAPSFTYSAPPAAPAAPVASPISYTAAPSPAPMAYAAPSAAPVTYAAAPSPASVTYAAAPSPAPISYSAPSPAPISYSAPSPAPISYAAPSPAPAPAMTTYAAAPSSITYTSQAAPTYEAPQVTYAAPPVQAAPATYVPPTPPPVYAAAPAAPQSSYSVRVSAPATPAPVTTTYAAPQISYAQPAAPQYMMQQRQVFQQPAPVYRPAYSQPVVQSMQSIVMPPTQQVIMPAQQPMQMPMILQQQQQPAVFQGAFQAAHVGAAPVQRESNNFVDDNEPPMPQEGEVHILICGIDYSCDTMSWAGPPPHGHGPLDTKYAFEMMIDLARRSGCSTIQTLWNEQCTQQNMLAMIQEVGSKCQNPEDTFVFYYTGHGDQLPNDRPGEMEAMDQCFCLLDNRGCTDGPQPDPNFRAAVWMRDDTFAHAVLNAVPDSAKILVLCDCCHSGTMCDFTPDSQWVKRQQRAISISGCEDKETSAGTGKGGMFTRAMTKAIQDYNNSGNESFNVSGIYNLTLEHYNADKTQGHTQNISIHGVMNYPNQMAWPLQPRDQYISPANAHMREMHITH